MLFIFYRLLYFAIFASIKSFFNVSVSIENLQSRFDKHPGLLALKAALKEKTIKNVFTQGMQGSEACLIFSALYKHLKYTQLFILYDLEEAGYFYNDLVQLNGNENTLFFPSSFRRAAKYGQTDSANEILRMEILSRLQQPDRPLNIVTYPEAVAEKVISSETLKKNTLSIVVGEKTDSAFAADILREYGFEEVDYVY